MSLVDAVRIALRAIAANRLRSALTALGLIIGVSSVIVLIAVGQGAQKGVTERIRGLGTNLIFVRPGTAQGTAQTQGARGAAMTLVASDADAIEQAGIPGIAGVSSQINFPAQAITSAQNVNTTVIGTTANYVDVRGVSLSSGSFISPTDVSTRGLAIVLGAAVAPQLFPEEEPLGQTVRLSLGGGRVTFQFRVVGVMAPRGGSSGGLEDSYVYVPVSSVQNRIAFVRNPTGQVNVSQIDIKTAPKADQALIKDQVTALLMQRHNVAEPDFRVLSQDDLLGAASAVSLTLSILLGSVAGISLIVGGIGVMNIMLVSVAERIREIGIRRAVGAQANDIVKQFVTEALTLCLVGGLIGTGVGVGAAVLLGGRAVAGQTMTTVIQPWSIGIAFAVAAGVGLISGSYPAYRATAVDPITALRNE
ncbi:MAG: FtsX-like permease family protein [Chloroflexi bacterium]|nr:FtsX-like permease family protein [Chloroflexota bacterium]